MLYLWKRLDSIRRLTYLTTSTFKGLDDALKESLYDVILNETKKAKRTVICVTHDIKEAESLGESIYLTTFCPDKVAQ